MSASEHPLIQRLHHMIQDRSLLKHPYYQAWQTGELTLDDLREYAQQYYYFESAFPCFLSAIHSRCPVREIRQNILENLWDEENGPSNHRELWLDFCEGIGLKPHEIERIADMDAIQRSLQGTRILVYKRTSILVDTYTHLCTSNNYQDGLAALYAYESQIPALATAKIQNLRDHYNVTDPKTLQFFATHQTQDRDHSQREAQGIVMYISQADCDHIERSAKEALDAWWGFLDELNEYRERRNKISTLYLYDE